MTTTKPEQPDWLASMAAFAEREARCAMCQKTFRGGTACPWCEEAAKVEKASTVVAIARRTIPPRHAWAELGSRLLLERVHPVSAIEAGKRAIMAQSLVLLGDSGAGKTSLGCALLVERMRREPHRARTFRYVSSYQLANAQLRAKAGREVEVIELAKSAALLLLDDLGAEPSLATSAVPEVIAHRHELELPTWFTSGFPSEEITARYGNGIARRIYHHATAIDFVLPPEARR